MKQNMKSFSPHARCQRSRFPYYRRWRRIFSTLDIAREYVAEMDDTPYHKDRMRAMNSLLMSSIENDITLRDYLSSVNYTLLEFGIGGGSQIKLLDLQPKNIIGIDISEHMIEISKENLSSIEFKGYCGSVEQLSHIANESVEIALCLNTFEYLDTSSQLIFFNEVSRIIKKGGYLIIMTGNELFDLFALNSGTADFFNKYLGQKDVKKLLTESYKEPYKNADRRNPLNFKYELIKFGFTEIAQSFSQWHKKLPSISINDCNGDELAAREACRDHNYDPNTSELEDMWKALFQCTIFASLSRKL